MCASFLPLRAADFSCNGLPCHHIVHDFLLFGAGAAEIDPCGFDALVPHQVCEEGDVVAFGKEIFGEAVPKRMRVDHLGVQAVFFGIFFKLACNVARGYAPAEAVHEKISRVKVVLLKPFFRLRAQSFGDIEPSDLAAFGIDVNVSGPDMFHLDLLEFADARSRSRKVPDNEIPCAVILLAQFFLEENIVGIADDVFEESLVLFFDGFEAETVLFDELEPFVERHDAQVDRLDLEIVDKEGFVGDQACFVKDGKTVFEVFDGEQIGHDGVLRHVRFAEIVFKIVVHNVKI